MTIAHDVSDVAQEPLPAVALVERRRRVLGEVLADVGRTAEPVRAPVLAQRTYGEGCVALALGGVFDGCGLARLRTLIADLDPRATVELVIDLSQLVGCDAALVRVLGGLRVRRLVAGTRVELHHSPPELVAALGCPPPAAFTVIDEYAPDVR